MRLTFLGPTAVRFDRGAHALLLDRGLGGRSHRRLGLRHHAVRDSAVLRS